MRPGHDERTVVVWRERLLPPSETFILNQVRALQTWRPVLVGLRAERDGLPIAEVAPCVTAAHGVVPNRVFRGRPDLRRPIRTLLRRPSTRLVHAHFLTDAMAVLPAVRRAGLPLVVTCHGNDVTRRPEALPHGRSPERLREIADYASAFVCVSEFIAERTAALGVAEEKVQVLPIGVPVEPRRTGSAGARSGVLFVGRLVPKKNCADVLEAVARLPRGLRGVEVTVVGDGPLRADLERRATELGVTARFLGNQTPAQVAQHMKASAVLCNPSGTAADGDAEGFGMIFLEAASHELPVVAYRSGGVPEAVTDGSTGLLGEERDLDALADNLRALLADESRNRAFGRNARARVESSFDIAHRTPALEDLFDSVSGAGMLVTRSGSGDR